MATAAGEIHSQVIDGGQIESWLRQAIVRGAENLVLCSAYIRSEALRSLFAERTAVSGRVLVRWRLEDLAYGASDLGVFDECRRLGLSLFMRLDFHGKAYAVPEVGVAIGSANLTLSGLGLHERSNEELGTLIEYNEKSSDALSRLFEGARKVDQDLVDQLATCLPAVPKTHDMQWPEPVNRMLIVNQTRDRLFVDECFWADHLIDAAKAAGELGPNHRHDLELLGLAVPATRLLLKSRFSQSPMFRWLTTYLSSCPDQIAYFGELSSALHAALICDPAPWRSTVKQLLQNLLALVQELGVECISIDRPHHSQRIRLCV